MTGRYHKLSASQKETRNPRIDDFEIELLDIQHQLQADKRHTVLRTAALSTARAWTGPASDCRGSFTYATIRSLLNQ